MTEFKEALKWWNDDQNGHKEDIYPEDKIIEYGKIIRRALLIADRLMQEPSEDALVLGMEKSVLGRPSIDDETYVMSIFKAMRDQLIREIEE